MTYPHTRTSLSLNGVPNHQFGSYAYSRAEVLLTLHNGTQIRVHCTSESSATELMTDCIQARRGRCLTKPHFNGTDLHGDDIHRVEASVV